MLELFPRLAERLAQQVRTMSGGEQQMVAVGRALMSAPNILLLDEPSLGLSPLMCRELFASLARIRDKGLGILLVEQNAKRSLAIADRGYLIANGRIVGEGSAESLRNDPAVQRAYLGAAEPGRTCPRRTEPDGMKLLDGKICIVTGAAGSLGLADRRAVPARGRPGDAGRPRRRGVAGGGEFASMRACRSHLMLQTADVTDARCDRRLCRGDAGALGRARRAVLQCRHQRRDLPGRRLIPRTCSTA